MDHSYIIKIKITSTLDIRTPIATWVLARLFNEDLPTPRKELLRNLCQASFDSMVGDSDFSDTIQDLLQAKYIEESEKEYTDFVPVRDNTTLAMVAGISGTPRTREVTRKREGYVITEEGIIAFRKQIATPIEKIKPHIERVAEYKVTPFRRIVNVLRDNSNVLQASISLCIENAPQILDFIKTMAHELSAIGIPIS